MHNAQNSTCYIVSAQSVQTILSKAFFLIFIFLLVGG